MITLVAATSKNWVIGNKGQIPWYLPDDFKHFKKVTENGTVVMGKNTYLSIGKPLPNRTNVVISDEPLDAPGCTVVNKLEEALSIAKDVFIIGGGMLYKATLPIADKIILTKVDVVCEGDTYFPELKDGDWVLTDSVHHNSDNKHPYSFDFNTYERRR